LQEKQQPMLPTRVTFLELHERSSVVAPPIAGIRLALLRAYKIPVHFYRYLYETIGKQHHWANRRFMSDGELKEFIDNKNIAVYILYADGCPAGFSELNLFGMPDFTEISYFGLVPDYRGIGLSRFFFKEILNAAWENEPSYLKIQTNSLDNPRALQLYQKFGFVPVDVSDAFVKAWN